MFSISFKAIKMGLVSTTLLFSLIFQANANEHFNMRWSNSQYNDPLNKGRLTSFITIGVPETDNRMGGASCFAGSTAGFPAIEFAANVGNLPVGAGIDIEFYSDAGPMLYRGEVKAPLSEEDYTGVRLNIDASDPLWSVLSRMSGISYRVQGQQIDLPLRGSSRAIARFLNECRFYQTGSNSGGIVSNNPPQSPLPPNNQPFDPRWATCDTLRSEVSRNSDTPVSMTFVNNSDGYRAILWIDFSGQPKDYAGLNPGEQFSINTFLTHPWMITDGPGNCLEMFMPQQGVSVFNITAPNRDFGPE
jgi:hypothetical protein